MKQQVDQAYSSAGDKYRLTLINMSAVENWFDPTKEPRSAKKRSVLLVPCARHCRVSDMDLESGTWLRDVTYARSDGEDWDDRGAGVIGPRPATHHAVDPPDGSHAASIATPGG